MLNNFEEPYINGKYCYSNYTCFNHRPTTIDSFITPIVGKISHGCVSINIVGNIVELSTHKHNYLCLKKVVGYLNSILPEYLEYLKSIGI